MKRKKSLKATLIRRAKHPSRTLYQTARLIRDVEVVASGDLKKILRRIKNKILGRVIAKGIWKMWQ